MNVHSYDDRFFQWVDRSATRSAAALIPCVNRIVSPKSVLDVGCGRGAWLAVWHAQPGVDRVLGIDGEGAHQSQGRPFSEFIRAADLEAGFFVGERFGLVQCLEVAEHLSAAAAPRLVSSLVLHGDVILFSAGRPGDGGEYHINEQEPEYWRALFAVHGFRMYDTVRPRIANIPAIDPWYRYNAFLYARPEIAARLGFDGDLVQEPLRAKSYESTVWRARRMMLRPLPINLVTRLAQLRYRIANRFFQPRMKGAAE
jgi:SAM-dependent methyltransferase